MSATATKVSKETIQPLVQGSDYLLSGAPVELQVAIIAAASALGAAIFAFIAAMITAKVQRRNAELEAKTASNIKLAEFRQLWIDRLREDFVSLKIKIAQQPENIDRELGEHIYRIFLMINKDDPHIEEIRSLINECLKGGAEGRNAQVRLLSIFQRVLKNEWEVVKVDLKGNS